ncbi:hypothetical protein V1264_000125 [Littorina saxatilis]|uniref:Reverse transcriptase n=1 Tax=Littorina saxatilis TaxID=31220 RepID=A0AAN9BZ55_9CAEN
MPRRQVMEADSPLLAFKQDGIILGLSGIELADYIEKRRLEEINREEKKLKEEKEMEEEAKREERRARERREEIEMQQEFELRKMREMVDLGLNQNVNQNNHHMPRESSSKIHINLPILDDKDDIEAYFKQFERIAKLSDWDEDEWAIRLSGQLRGQARQVYIELSDEESVNYDEVKTAILQRFQLTAESYRKRFKEVKWEKEESIKECRKRMKTYLDRWKELSEKEGKSGDLEDLILTDKLLDVLTPDQNRFVRERNPTNIDDVVKHVQTYIDARDAGGRMPPRQSQGGERRFDNKPRNGPPPTGGNAQSDNRQPHKGNNFGQRSGGNPNRQTGNRPPPNTKGCFRCGGPHMMRDCPKRLDGPRPSSNYASTLLAAVRTSGDEVTCQCRKGDAYDPNCRVQVEGKDASGIRDTGATCIVVNSSLVPPECYTGEHQNITLADTRQRKMPIAVVQMDTPFFSGVTRVLVAKALCHQVLIGNIRKDMDENEISVPVFPIVKREAEPQLCAPVQTRNQEKQKAEKKPWVPKQIDLGQIRPEDLSREQKTDPSLAKIRDRVAKGAKDGTHYEWKKDILYRIYMDNGSPCKQVVVPECFRTDVLKLAHDTPMAGHQGVRRTRDRIWRDFYWPGICGDVKRYCASCDACQRSSRKGATKKVPMKSMPLIGTPFERVGVDIVGPIIPASNRGHKYILTMVDYATRYVEATPLKDIRTETVSEALWVMWTKVGIPREVLTDRGSQFTSEVMEEVNKLLNIKGIHTTPWHPQTNGLTEKFNSTLKHMMKKLCQEQPKDWDKFLPALLFAYREVPQESLKFSPFELLYGREVRGPMQVLRQVWTNEDTADETRSTVSHIVDLTNKIEKTCEIAKNNLSKAALKYTKAYNKRTKERSLAVGDKVLLLLPEKHNKLQLTWKGPYPVIEKVGSCNYRVKIKGRDKLLHANLLKLYVERESESKENKSEQTKAKTIVEVPEIVAVVVDDVHDDEMGDLGIDRFPMLSLKPKEGPKDVNINPNLEPQRQAEIQALCDRKVKALKDIPGKCVIEECEFKLTSQEPVHVKQYKLPFSQVEIVKKEVNDMLKLGVIEPSISPYNSPIVLVKKKDGSIRFCIDYRQLNREVVFDSEPIPDVPLIFAKLQKGRYLSKIDLTKGYWQIPIKEEDKEKTAFSTPLGQFQFAYLPFGVKTASMIFTRMMRKLLEPLGRDDVEHFIDDIIIATETWEQHVEAVEAVLSRLEEVCLTAKPSKCYFGYAELDYLGHHVGQGMTKPDDEKTEKIRSAKRPETKKEVRAFLGLAGFYRKYVSDYANLSAPLTDLTKKGLPERVVWNEECEEAFTKLKQSLVCKPVLLLPDIDKPYTVRSDASDIAIGAVLLQDQGQGLQPVAYASRKLNKAERNYSVIEKECLGVVWSIKKFEQYLYSVHFTLETDHQPLTYLQKTKTENGRLMRWALQLQQYSFTVKIIRGVDNVGADYLSRLNN